MKQLNISLSKRIMILLMVLSTTVGCDQTTKHVAKNFLDPGVMNSYLGDSLRIVYAENSGAFLGLGASLPGEIRTAIFVVLAFCLLLGLGIYALRKKPLGTVELAAIALIIGGGLGNIIDRVFNGGVVVDFLNVGVGSLRTGIFNVADMVLMLGIIAFAFSQQNTAAD